MNVAYGDEQRKEEHRDDAVDDDDDDNDGNAVDLEDNIHKGSDHDEGKEEHVSAHDCDDDCDDDTDDDDDDDDDGVVVVVIGMNTQTIILLPAKRAEKYREEHNEVVI